MIRNRRLPERRVLIEADLERRPNNNRTVAHSVMAANTECPLSTGTCRAAGNFRMRVTLRDTRVRLGAFVGRDARPRRQNPSDAPPELEPGTHPVRVRIDQFSEHTSSAEVTNHYSTGWDGFINIAESNADGAVNGVDLGILPSNRTNCWSGSRSIERPSATCDL